jgi:hypothetical protein
MTVSEKDEPYCGLPIHNEPISERRSLHEALEDPSICRTFHSPYVERLAFTTMEMIEQEKARNQNLDRLASILQQDDPWYRDVELGDDALVAEVWERLQDHICYSNAYLKKLMSMRDQLMRVARGRAQLWARMEEMQQHYQQQQQQQQQEQQDEYGHESIDHDNMDPIDTNYTEPVHTRSGKKKTTRTTSTFRQVKTKKRRVGSSGHPTSSNDIVNEQQTSFSSITTDHTYYTDAS